MSAANASRGRVVYEAAMQLATTMAFTVGGWTGAVDHRYARGAWFFGVAILLTLWERDR